MYFLLRLSYSVQSYLHFCQVFFTMSTHRIWSGHMTQDANFEIFYFVLIPHIFLGKVTNFEVEKLSTSEYLSAKILMDGGVWKTPLMLFRLNDSGNFSTTPNHHLEKHMPKRFIEKV